MPSLHIGWAVLIAVVVCRTGPRLARVLACLHALTTVAVVTVTANHWLLDGLVAVALLGIAFVLVPRPAADATADSTADSTMGRRALPGEPAAPAGSGSTAPASRELTRCGP